MKDFSLINTPFELPFAGKNYMVKKANITQVIEFQKRGSEIAKENDGTGDRKDAVYALFLTLNAADPSITEEYVRENTAGDIEPMEVLITLGFANQQKVATYNRIRNALGLELNGGKFSEQ